MDGSPLIAGGSHATPEAARALSPLALAYVGDAVYELYVRERAARIKAPVRSLHDLAVKWTSSEGQGVVWAHMQPELRPDEEEIARRGRNVKSQPPRGARHDNYKKSTALEAVVGYLYLTGRRERLAELLGRATAAAAAQIERGGDALPFAAGNGAEGDGDA